MLHRAMPHNIVGLYLGQYKNFRRKLDQFDIHLLRKSLFHMVGHRRIDYHRNHNYCDL